MPTVLFDLTPLDTPSRYRGYGRYVRELAIGLSRLSEQEREGLTLLGLTRLHWTGACELTTDLASFAGHEDLAPDQSNRYEEAYKRRIALWKAVRDTGAELVHLGDPQATPLARRWSRAKYLVTCHDLIPLRYPNRYYTWRDGWGAVGKRLEMRRYRSADHVVAISEATKSDLTELLAVPEGRITRVYNGVDVERWSQPADAAKDTQQLATLGLAGEKYLIYAGDTDWRKNVEGMMAGLGHAVRKGVRVRLVFAGVLSPARAEGVDAMAARHGVAEHVTRLGHVSDEVLGVLFRRAVAHLFVSRAEGFGLTVVEAMASGCPVITTQATSLGEVAGDAAALVDPESPEQIGEAIALLCTDDDLRARYIAHGVERAKMFSNANQARGMIQLYRRLVDG